MGKLGPEGGSLSPPRKSRRYAVGFPSLNEFRFLSSTWFFPSPEISVSRSVKNRPWPYCCLSEFTATAFSFELAASTFFFFCIGRFRNVFKKKSLAKMIQKIFLFEVSILPACNSWARHLPFGVSPWDTPNHGEAFPWVCGKDCALRNEREPPGEFSS